MRGRILAISALALVSYVPESGADHRAPAPPGAVLTALQSTAALQLGRTPAARLQRAAKTARIEKKSAAKTKRPTRLTVDIEKLSDAEVERRVEQDLPSLGSMSLGRPNAGAQLNAVRMPEGKYWQLVDPRRSWATQETVDYLIAAIEQVNKTHPGGHKLYIGHLSRKKGGRLHPHRSHQSGRDVDISYYYKPKRAAWYQNANKHTLDLPRTWALVRALVTHTDVEMMFIDFSVQRLLKDYALSIGEDKAWINSVFRYRSNQISTIVRHTWGHVSHIHVRFYNPRAQEVGRRCYPYLVKRKLIKPRHYFVSYSVRPGDTLASLALKAGTSPEAITKANGLGDQGMTPGVSYYIPMRGHVTWVGSTVIPPRTLPPETVRVDGPKLGSSPAGVVAQDNRAPR